MWIEARPVENRAQEIIDSSKFSTQQNFLSAPHNVTRPLTRFAMDRPTASAANKSSSSASGNTGSGGVPSGTAASHGRRQGAPVVGGPANASHGSAGAPLAIPAPNSATAGSVTPALTPTTGGWGEPGAAGGSGVLHGRRAADATAADLRGGRAAKHQHNSDRGGDGATGGGATGSIIEGGEGDDGGVGAARLAALSSVSGAAPRGQGRKVQTLQELDNSAALNVSSSRVRGKQATRCALLA